MATLEFRDSRFEEAFLDCSETRFARLDSENGTFFVACDKAEPYLDCYKIIVLIGNPSTLTYRGADFRFSWSENPYTRFRDPGRLRKTNRSFQGSLLPGTWNTVQINIGPATSKELANLYVTMTTNTVALARNSR